MKNGFGTYLILILSVLFIGCDTDYIDWRKTFDSEQSIPMGTYVLRKELTQIFKASKITDISGNTAQYFEKNKYDLNHENYFYINNSGSNMPEDAWVEISHFVENGGSGFLSFYELSDTLKTLLGLETKAGIQISEINGKQIKMSIKRPDGEKSYSYDLQSKENFYFSEFNPKTTEVLGYSIYAGNKNPNFIKLNHGKGYFLIHTEPVVFSNYEMLEKNHYQYVLDALSYLKPADILWDNKRIQFRNAEDSVSNDGGFFSSLSFITKHKSLRAALYTLLALGILYLIFNSKRRQRAQEIILPYPNYTLDFAKTLAELYRNHSDHTAMVKYKLNYFLDHLRLKYNITPKETETDFSELLSAKSGADLDICKKLVSQINTFRPRNYFNKQDFIKLESLITSFNQNQKFNGRESK